VLGGEAPGTFLGLIRPDPRLELVLLLLPSFLGIPQVELQEPPNRAFETPISLAMRLPIQIQCFQPLLRWVNSHVLLSQVHSLEVIMALVTEIDAVYLLLITKIGKAALLCVVAKRAL